MTCTLRFFLLLSISGGGWAQSRLDRIFQQGVLKVYTTGDYRPYSFLRADGYYEGIDIAMAQSLADSLPARIQWVPTTWKNLMRDFSARDCDIAVGGVSVTLDRQKRASFSLVISVEGKIPLVRCVDRPRLHSIEQMNQSAVRKQLPRATLILSHDNAAIFQQLVDQKADIMITNVKEALFQQQRHPSLCAVQPHCRYSTAKKPICYRGTIAYGKGMSTSGCIYIRQTAVIVRWPANGGRRQPASGGDPIGRRLPSADSAWQALGVYPLRRLKSHS